MFANNLNALRIRKDVPSFSPAFPRNGKITSLIMPSTFDNILCELSMLPFTPFLGPELLSQG